MGDIVKIILFAVAFAIPIHYFLIQPYRVPDDSFSPVLQKGDIVLISRLFRASSFTREDLVVYRVADKRVGKIIGLPHERVRINDGILSIKTVPEDAIIKEMPLFGDVSKSIQEIGAIDEHEYFVINESRLYESPGLVDVRSIIGKPKFRIFPFNRITKLY